MTSCNYTEYNSDPLVILVLASSWREQIHTLAATPWTVMTVKRKSPSKNYTNGKLLAYLSVCVIIKVDTKVCSYLTRVRDKEEEVTESPDDLVLIRDPDEIRHPSLTVDFTFKVSL